jgi:hypothetical protein
MKFLFAMFILALSGACQVVPFGTDGSAGYRIPAGSKIVLNTELKVPGNQWEYPIANAAYSGGVFDPRCFLRFHALQESPRHIPAGEYNIVEVLRHVDWIGAQRVGELVRVSRSNSGVGPSPIWFSTIMNLSVPASDDTLRLVCRQMQVPTAGRHLNVDEIRKALGEHWVLVLRAPA